jgi:hypothetical protein
MFNCRGAWSRGHKVDPHDQLCSATIPDSPLGLTKRGKNMLRFVANLMYICSLLIANPIVSAQLLPPNTITAQISSEQASDKQSSVVTLAKQMSEKDSWAR